MSFTDDDLKQVKANLERMRKILEPDDSFFLSFPRMDALLARLEAAEKVARWFNVIHVDDQNAEPYQDYLAWKKASGK